MIRPEAQRAYEDLLRVLEPLFGVHPVYYLDRSWLSIGTLDLLLFHLRGKRELSAHDQLLLKGAAALMGSLAYEVWSSAYNAVVDFGDSARGIELVASGGPFLPDNARFEIALETALQEFHQAPTSALPVFTTFHRHVGPYDNFVSGMGLGVISGSTLLGSGLWAEQPLDSFGTAFEEVVKWLGKSAADGYANRYPEEQCGQVAELYVSGLIFPPQMMSESVPGITTVQGLAAFLSEYALPKQQILKLASNLIRLPDDGLSSVGFLLLAAYVDPKSAPAEFYAFRESRGRAPLYLRPALILLRELLGLGEDWLEPASEGGSASGDGAERYNFEQISGLMPWIRLPWKYLERRSTDTRYQRLLHAAKVFDLSECAYVCDTLLEEEPGDIELRLQRLLLHHVKGDFSRLLEGARRLLTEPGAEGRPEAHLFVAHGELGLGNTGEAAAAFARARLLVSEIHPLFAETVLNQGWCQVLLGNLPEAERHFSTLRPGHEYPLTLTLNRFGVARALGKTEQADQFLREAQMLFPSDRRVFSLTLEKCGLPRQ